MTNIQRHIIIFATAVACAACSSDDQPAMPTAPDAIIFGTSTGMQWTASAGSRAAGDMLAAELPYDLGVLGYNNDAKTSVVFDNQHVWYLGSPQQIANEPNLLGWSYKNHDGSDNEYPYSPEQYWQQGFKYKFMAYSPWCPSRPSASSSTWVYVENINKTYDTFAHFVWRGVPEYSADDYMIAAGQTRENYTSSTSKPYEQIFDMQHLMARVRFNFKLGTRYAELRRIRVKEIKISTENRTWDADVTFDDDGEASVEWTPALTTPTAATVELLLEMAVRDGSYEDGLSTDLSDKPGLLLSSAEYRPLANLYVNPLSGTDRRPLTMTVKYDVYDLTDMCTRRDCTTSSALTLPWASMLAAHYYNVTILVQPDYLYVLSDNDELADGYIKIE